MARKAELRVFIDEELVNVFKDLAESGNHSTNSLAEYVIARYITEEKPVYKKQFEKYLDFSKQGNIFEVEDIGQEEPDLIGMYRSLDEEGQRTLKNVLEALSVSRAAQT